MRPNDPSPRQLVGGRRRAVSGYGGAATTPAPRTHRPRAVASRWIGVLMALVLALSSVPAVAAPLRSAQAVVDEGLARALQRATETERIPVLLEAKTVAPSAPGPDANTERASRAARVAQRAGGAIHGELGIIGAVAADLTPAQIRQLASDADVERITLDAPVRAAADSRFDGGTTPIVYQDVVGAREAWRQGWTGRGVGVAILDSGIADNPALGKRVTQRVDFVSPSRPEEGDPGGHGTFLAGVLAAQTPSYRGIAPEASLVSVRVLDASGVGRMSTVIRGLEWAIRHRQDQKLRVVVLALSAPAAGSYRADPLAAAVELAWRSGLVVVAAAGNRGPAGGSVDTPGIDPLVVTVGATDDAGTVGAADDSVPFFSARGPTVDGLAKPDLVGPGRRIVSLRVPGSTIDREMPDRREGVAGFRLTGTSMSTAVVAGATAVLLQQRPQLRPDEVKAILVRSAKPLAGVDRTAQGAGVVSLASALAAPTPSGDASRQSPRPADGFLRSILPVLKASRDAVPGWDQMRWDQMRWDQMRWDQMRWDQMRWDQMRWDAATSTPGAWSGPSLD